MTQVDTLRIERLQANMKKGGLDVLVCRLPENVVYLTEYWPHHGVSVAVLPNQGRPILFVPEVEAEYAKPDWAEVIPFGWALVKDADQYQSYRNLLGSINSRLNLNSAKIGIEKSFEVVGSTYRAAEPVVPAAPWFGLLADVFGDANLVDATDLLQTSRAIKTGYELEKLRIANEIAEIGMREFVSTVEPGMTEAEVGALVEYHIRAKGPGYKGARLVRANAEVGAGPVNSTKCVLLVPSTTYTIREGDLVMVELGVAVDGYWADLTYMAVAGEPNDRQRDIHNTVLRAQQAAAQQVKAGAAWSDPDTAARAVLEEAGLAAYFVHVTGHGIGLRYHEGIPFLMPGATAKLEAGMVTSVEPGVYIPDFGGIRIEDIVAVGQDGPIFLSTPRQPW